MIGLKKEIIKRKANNDIYFDRNEHLNIANIARIINKPYNTTKRKIDNGSFTIKEACTIYEDIGFKAKNDYDALKYLFTEQED